MVTSWVLLYRWRIIECFKLEGTSGGFHTWWRTNWIKLLKGLYTTWRMVTSGIQQMVSPGTCLVQRFYQWPGKRNGALVEFAGDTKLRGPANAAEGSAAIWKDFSWLEGWANRSPVIFGRDKRKFLPLDEDNPLQWPRWDGLAGGSSSERAFGAWLPVGPGTKGWQQHPGLSAQKQSQWSSGSHCSPLPHLHYYIEFWPLNMRKML